MTSERERHWTVSPEGYKAMLQLHGYLKNCGLDAALLHLVYLRVSQINRCAFCIDMHAAEALRDGERAERIHCLVAWRECPFYSAAERAALAWAEALTTLAGGHPSEADYDAARAAFGQKGMVDLTYAICAINSWNRLGVGFRRPPASADRSAPTKA